MNWKEGGKEGGASLSLQLGTPKALRGAKRSEKELKKLGGWFLKIPVD